MLSARRKSDGETVNAYFESKANAPFYCLVCGDEVALKTGRSRVNHFAHVNPLACRYAENESDDHRRCKMEIFLSLQKEPHVRNIALERPIGMNRADVYSRRSKRHRTAIRGRTFNLAADFGPRNRDWWEGKGITIPAAKLYVDQERNSVANEFYEG